jgi:hypothetical protein
MDERRMGQNGDGAAADAFEKRLDGVGPNGKRERGPTGASMWREKEGWGAGAAVVSLGRPATAPDRWARAALLPHE